MYTVFNSDSINEINKCYAKYTELAYATSDIGMEIETRFMVDNKVNIYKAYYDKVFNYYKPKTAIIDTLEIRDVEDRDNTTWRLDIKENKGHLKVKLGDYIDKEFFDIKVSVSVEVKNQKTPKYLSKAVTVRNRKRYSVILEEGVMLDLTEIRQESKKQETKYQIEIEINDILKLSRLQHWTTHIWKILHGTDLLYTINDKKQVINFVENILQQPLDYSILTNARQLFFKDIVYGGLVGCKNQKYSTEKSGQITYSVSYKTDGVRHMLVITNNGDVWLINHPNIFNLIKRADPKYKIFGGTILDVEYVPLESRKNNYTNTKNWIHLIDALSVATNQGEIRDVRNSDRTVRTKQISFDLKSIEGDDILEFYIKDNFYFRTPDEFFEVIANVFNGVSSLPYKTDGLIFTPGETKYKLYDVESAPDYLRVLTSYPDICKWKPVEEITIDLKFIDGRFYASPGKGTGKEQGQGQGQSKELVEFKKYKTNSKLRNNTVYEFKIENEVLVPIRERPDKPFPNRINVVNSNIKAIQENISINDLCATNNRLVFKYHNRIKKLLISQIVKPGDSVLDIGGGQGGDLPKYKDAKADAIYYVEPNQTNIVELKNRVKEYRMEGKVQGIITGGEDYKAITKMLTEKVDVVSLMLSLSFFWKDEQMLDDLVTTITNNLKPDGKIIFLTIDGDALRELAHSSIRTENAPKKRVVFGDNDYIILPDPKDLQEPSRREVEIKLSNTILESETNTGVQKEWLVILSDLTKRLRKYGYDLTEIYRADDEKLLNSYGQRLTRLYSYGYYSKIK